MYKKARFVVPVAFALKVAAASKPLRAMDKNRIRLGILDNKKSNADHFLNMVVDELKRQLPIVSVVSMRKQTPMQSAAPEIFADLEKEVDCVISAMAD